MQITETQNKLLKQHLKLVLEANKITNITNISSLEDGKLLHIVDSLQILDYIDTKSGKRLLDMGSGAGYPGIPIAICTNLEVVLCEKVNKKSVLLDQFINELGIHNCLTFNGRLEEFVKIEKYSIDYITARALSNLNSLLELSSPLLKINGHLICYKSFECNDEIKKSLNVIKKLGYSEPEIKIINLNSNIKRKLVIYKKTHLEQIKLPRKMGFAQKKPLS